MNKIVHTEKLHRIDHILALAALMILTLCQPVAYGSNISATGTPIPIETPPVLPSAETLTNNHAQLQQTLDQAERYVRDFYQVTDFYQRYIDHTLAMLATCGLDLGSVDSKSNAYSYINAWEQKQCGDQIQNFKARIQDYAPRVDQAERYAEQIKEVAKALTVMIERSIMQKRARELDRIIESGTKALETAQDELERRFQQ